MAKKSKSSSSSSESGEMDFQKLFYSLLERKWVVLGCLAGTVLLGILYIIVTPRQYSATTVVQVEQEESKFVNIEDITTQDLKQLEVLKTIETNLSCSPLLLGVIDRLKLTPEQLRMKPNPDGTPLTDGDKVLALGDDVNVKLLRGTRLINVTATNTSPVLAQQIADEIVKEYVRINAAQRAGLSSEANKFLLEESDVLKNQVKIAEQEAQDFKDAHPGVALENSQQFMDEKLLALNGKMNDAKEQLFKVRSDYAQVQRLLSGAPDGDRTGQLLRISSVSSDPAVLQIQKDISESQAALAQIAKRYRPKHPAYIQAEAQLAGLKAGLDNAVVQAAEGLATAVEAARQTEANFEAELKVLEKAKVDNDKVAIPYTALSDEVDANRQLYDNVRMRLKETEVTRDIGTNEIQVATPAMLPLTPSKPKKLLVILASIIGGLMLGVCVTHALSAVDSSFKSVETVESTLGLPVLVAIQELGKVASNRSFLITQEPAGATAEAFRTLRTSLSIESGEAERNTILFTSAVPGEGKSFCAVNYAISLAQLGQPTLIIDGDLRLPTVAKTLLGKEPKRGVNSVLSGESTLKESVRSVPDIPNLSVLAAGARVNNPAELLAGRALSNMLDEASDIYNWIVIDTAPVLAVSDTLLIVKHAKCICLVLHAGKTPARSAQRACDIIESAHAKPTGILLNHISTRNHSYYYYYSGKYGEGVYGAVGKGG